ncbi:hypothetical protein CC1G_04655 [Coprinopsis cinerea okayama7|uniref:Uncharacterized protein n=1 Tax=Coprinopsis cinerea (strain Okayama-7 / 130 / ATCC MYA-4618 / FGSC 9003) TaxID=240176 RepID=A8N548_COPC7|nr:hypothetical protein CC1G_04655 [Coprinopsis cinerea okayama7\|eukprot:XP_001829966.1 hypothetical protein CC1G_04655 [Coprinopsis cinerea okayama7\
MIKKPGEEDLNPPPYGNQAGTYPVIEPYPTTGFPASHPQRGGPSPQPQLTFQGQPQYSSAHQHQQQGPTPLANVPHTPPPPPPDASARLLGPRYTVAVNAYEPAWKRFLKALGIALFIYLLFSIFVESVVEVARWTVGHRHGRHQIPRDYPVPGGIVLGECTTSSGWRRTNRMNDAYDYYTPPKHALDLLDKETFPLAAETSFSFPLSILPSFANASRNSGAKADIPLSATKDNAFIVLSRGSMSAGDANIVTSPSQEKNKASVIVTVRYFEDKIRDLARVCSIVDGEGKRGVGIFTPDREIRDPKKHRIYFETTLILPELDGDERPLRVKKLETDVHNTAHHFAVDKDLVAFHEVSFKGSNGAVTIEKPLSTPKGKIRTSNGPISGTFNTSDSLLIQTQNGEVRVQVGLDYLEEKGKKPNLEIRTSNGQLRADISLSASSSSLAGSSKPAYDITTHTANARLSTSVLSTMPSSQGVDLTYDGSTANSPASLRLYPSYTGDFVVSTANGAADLRMFCADLLIDDSVLNQNEAEDEMENDNASADSGRGQCKERRVTRRVVRRNRIEGRIEWLGEKGRDSNGGEGRVRLRSSNGPAVLSL